MFCYLTGGLLSYFRGLLGSREMRILILGLDGAGKTTILYRLQVGEVVTTIPTIGFNVEQVTYKNLKFQVWDLGGQTSIRPYWRCYYSNTDAIIYVVDSVDRDRIGISKDELLYMLRVSTVMVVDYDLISNVWAPRHIIHSFISWTQISNLQEDELAGAILVVLANKQDMEGCMSIAEVHQALGLEALKNRTFQVSRPNLHCSTHSHAANFTKFIICWCHKHHFPTHRYSRRQQRRAKAWTKQWTGYRMHSKPRNKHKPIRHFCFL